MNMGNYQPAFKIYHAFNGFLYFPIFLAKKFRLLPDNCELIYVRSDVECINRLLEFHGDPKTVAVGICDPIAGGFNHIDPSYGGDSPIDLLATMISGIPFWMCSSCRKFTTVAKESGIADKMAAIDAVIASPQGTTNRVLATRFLRQNGLNNGRILDAPFGAEFCQEQVLVGCNIPTKNVLIATSDVLHVAACKHRQDRVVFSYAKNYQALNMKPFLFTGVLANRQSIENHPIPIAIFLQAIQKSIQLARNALENNTDCVFNTLVDIFSQPEHGSLFQQLGIDPSTDQGKLDSAIIVRDALKLLIVDTDSYALASTVASVEQTRDALVNAKRLWTDFGTEEDAEKVRNLDIRIAPYLAFLLDHNWEKNIFEYNRGQLQVKIVSHKPQFQVPVVATRLFEYFITPCLFVILVLAAIHKSCSSGPPFTSDKFAKIWLGMSGVFLGMLICWGFICYFGCRWRRVIFLLETEMAQGEESAESRLQTWAAFLVSYVGLFSAALFGLWSL